MEVGRLNHTTLADILDEPVVRQHPAGAQGHGALLLDVRWADGDSLTSGNPLSAAWGHDSAESGEKEPR